MHSCFHTFILTRQGYLHHRCLHENQMGGDEYISRMDQQLPEVTILLFRRLAHAKVIIHQYPLDLAKNTMQVAHHVCSC